MTFKEFYIGGKKVKELFINGKKAKIGGAEPAQILGFKAVDDAVGLSLTKTGAPDPISLETKMDDGDWTAWDLSEITIPEGSTLYVRRTDDDESNTFSKDSGRYYTFSSTGTGKLEASGSVQYLLGKSGTRIDAPTYCYYYMFQDCSSLTKAPELPATTLANYCYYFMFSGCSSLTEAPELPATTLAQSCYQYMFYNCSSLTKAPELPATTLADLCYGYMFHNCTSLTQAPELPATTLAAKCYNQMFDGCSSLTKAPELPATTLAQYCYFCMFYNCSSLTEAPELPATTLDNYCYQSMFDGTGLREIPLVQTDSYPFDCMVSFVSNTQIEQFDADQYFQTYDGKSFTDNCFKNMFYSTPMIYAKLGNIPLVCAGMFANTQLLNVDFSNRTDQTIPRMIAPIKSEQAAFDNIPEECRLIVPDDMFDAFSNDSNWGTKFAGHIVKASEA